jgi:hypothetical protein
MSGILMVGAGVIWLLVAMLMPAWPADVIGVVLLIVAGGLSLVFLSRMLIP